MALGDSGGFVQEKSTGHKLYYSWERLRRKPWWAQKTWGSSLEEAKFSKHELKYFSLA